jgi:hypothetical protein
MISPKKALLFVSFFFASFLGVFFSAFAFDHSALDDFLKKHVNEKGEVNYQSVAEDPKPLNDYLAHLMTAGDLEKNAWPREELLAFWLNAYHATLLKLVSEHYPVTSVQKIPGFWDISLIRLGSEKAAKQYSLNDIRVNELIGVYHDEKIHLALSVAARGGPKLMREAFTGPKVEGQLFLLTRQFVNDPLLVDIKPGRKKIRISKIFKWYGKDFKLDFGTPEPLGKFSETDTAVLSFLAYYLEDEVKGEYLQEANYKIEYPAFDWSLNDQEGSSGGYSR